jgi:hypothetical protein
MAVLQDKAQAFVGYLETRTRNNGDRFVCAKDDAPGWVADIIRAVHGDLSPDDWTYQTISDCADALAEGSEREPESDTYTRDLIAWLGSYPDALADCDCAVAEWGPGDDIESMIRQGQQYAIYRIYSDLRAMLEEQDIDDDTDDEQEAEEEHTHVWGPVEVSRFSGNPHRRCACGAVSLDLDEEEAE